MRKPRRPNGAMAASTHFVNTLGARARPNGSALNWYAIPPNANLRYLRCLWWIGTWKYASFKSIVINQSFGLINCTSLRGVNILNCSGMSALFNTRRSNWPIIPVSFGYEEVTAVEACSFLLGRNSAYCFFSEQGDYLFPYEVRLFSLHHRLYHSAEWRRGTGELPHVTLCDRS